MLVSVRLPDDLVERIDAAAGKGRRGEWLRNAAERALGGVEPAVELVRLNSVTDRQSGSAVGIAGVRMENARQKPRRNIPEIIPVAGEPAFRRPDDRLLWVELRKKRGTARGLRDRLGWLDMRVERAVSSLLSAGLVRMTEGVLEAVE